ncbi:uncharacterized protein LOC135225480 [Macrobrachium nipponense]|uniref:uncharacterized protein LOC135225480 n=1 Tax=Macrobrachium nipponense TaxID=159736 RepID=UPI0030C86C1B
MLQVLYLVIYLTTSPVINIFGSQIEARWAVKYLDYRYNHSQYFVGTFNMTRIMCGVMCFHRADCVSFNHNKGTDECDVLNTAYYAAINDTGLIAAPGWDYFNFLQPRPQNTTNYCPGGSVYLQYEQPAFSKYDPSLEGFACTNHSAIMAQAVSGKNCRLTLKYDVDYQNGTSPGYDGVVAPYYDALKQCLSNSCAGMTCTSGQCWLKTENHVLTGKTLFPSNNTLYWYAVCS